MTRRTVFSFVLLIVLLVTLPLAAFAQEANSVTVSDQEVMDGKVTVANVVSAGDGWMVIHKDQEGRPGPVIGWSAVTAGENANVVVELTEEITAPTTLWAMLHVDEGTVGTYEFPGPDVPADADVPSFVASPAASTPTTLPTTGADLTPWMTVVFAGLGLALGGLLGRRTVGR